MPCVFNVMSWLTRLASLFVGDYVRYLSIILFVVSSVLVLLDLEFYNRVIFLGFLEAVGQHSEIARCDRAKTSLN